MKLLEQQIYKQLAGYNEICFGPLVGELGWEVILLSGFIKKYKKDYPEKKIYVCTRTDRKELYDNCGLDDILVFDIPGDYDKFTARGNTLCIENDKGIPLIVDVSKQFKNLKDSVIQIYPETVFFSFETQQFSSTPPYELSNLDFRLLPNPANSDVIQNILSKKENLNKKIVTIFSRHRIDLVHRNWGESNWKSLFRKLKKNDDFIFFISGISPSFVKPKAYKNIYILEDIQKNYNSDVTTLGLCIEAIRNSTFTFGPQTSGILLANILKVPSLYFGKERDLVSKNYNPFNVCHQYVEVGYGPNFSYNISVDEIYNYIVNFNPTSNNNLNATPSTLPENMEYKLPVLHPTLSQITDPKVLREKVREFNMYGVRRSIPLELRPVNTNSEG